MLCAGISLTPSILFFKGLTKISENWNIVGQAFLGGIGISFGYFIYGISLIFVCPLANKLNPWKVKPWRGSWYSLQGVPWYYHNALTFLVRFTFLDFITPTPLNNLFFKMMGMKIGKGVVINTTYISDPCLITLEDHVTIGGSVTMFAHYGQKGILILAPVVIKKNATIGLKASIMGDVIIEEDVIIAPHDVILPKSRIGNEKKVS